MKISIFNPRINIKRSDDPCISILHSKDRFLDSFFEGFNICRNQISKLIFSKALRPDCNIQFLLLMCTTIFDFTFDIYRTAPKEPFKLCFQISFISCISFIFFSRISQKSKERRSFNELKEKLKRLGKNSLRILNLENRKEMKVIRRISVLERKRHLKHMRE